MKLHQLREQRTAKVAAMKDLVETAAAAGRDLTADESKQFDALKAEERSLSTQIERAEFLADAERRSAGTPVSDNATADFDRLAGSVSVVKVIRAQMEGRSLDGAEAEYAKEAERRTGRKAQGIFVPMGALETRANTTSSAADLVGTDHRADQYIGPLRDRLLARSLGVRVLSGLQGDVSIPKFGTGLATGWVAEGGNVPEGNMTFDAVTLTPRHVGGKTEMSRQLIQQSAPAIEQLVRDDLAYLIAKQIDSALIYGGGANEPVGVLNTVGIQTANLATLTWAAVLEMLEKAEVANVNAVNWLTNAPGKTKLASTLKEAGLPGYLLENGRMADLPLFSTNQIESDSNGTPVILGDWSQVLLGVWSEIDILVNPYAEPAYTRGGVQVRAMATCDIALRHPEAFVVATDLSA